MKRSLIALAAAGCMAGAGAASAQTTLTPRALGMGGSYVAVARGHEALFQNPANLGLPGTPYWSVAFPQFAMGADFVGFTAGELPDLIGYGELPQERLDQILAGVPSTGMETTLQVRIPLAAVQVRRFALGVSYAGSWRYNLGRDVVDLMLNGYEPGRTDYSVDRTGSQRADYIDVAAAYGRQIGRVSVGAAAHYLHGRTLSQSRLFEPEFDLETDDVRVEYREVLARGGRGYALDVGAAFQPSPRITVSAAVANAFSRMTWSRELRTRHLVLDRARFENRPGMGILDRLRHSEEKVDPTAAPFTVFEAARGLYAEAYVPAVLRAGVAYAREDGRTHVSASYEGALTGGKLGMGWERQAGIGIEQRVPLVRLRAGAATDLEGGRMLTAGVSLNAMHLGIAHTSQPGPEGHRRTGWSATFGLGLRTTGSMRQ